VLYNGFDMGRVPKSVDRGAVKARLGINTEKAVCMVGRFHPAKDWELFLQCAELVNQRFGPVCFVGIGDGPELATVRRRANDRPYVILPGRQARIEELLSSFDVGVLATDATQASEGIPNVLMKYMATALPTVATHGGGVDELVAHASTGFLTAPADAQAFAERVIWLLSHPEAATRMGANGQALIRNRFSLDRAMATLIALAMGANRPSGILADRTPKQAALM
jgi:glycosyltransferase involved in cell wall biosynthesis